LLILFCFADFFFSVQTCKPLGLEYTNIAGQDCLPELAIQRSTHPSRLDAGGALNVKQQDDGSKVFLV
jgi:hypothetical protein